jgi:hypothetical protein
MRIDSELKLKLRCEVLAQSVEAMKPVYFSQLSDTQRHLLETMVGAAIWYLPQSWELWTGRVSVNALRSIKEGKQPTRDHHYPRKVAARELFQFGQDELSGETLYRLYTEKYGRFNLITPVENRSVMKYQRSAVFVDPDQAYQRAGIQLVSSDEIRSLLDRTKPIRSENVNSSHAKTY